MQMSSFFRAHSALAQENDSRTCVKFASQIVPKCDVLFSTKQVTREDLDFIKTKHATHALRKYVLNMWME